MVDEPIQNNKDISEVAENQLADGGLIQQKLDPLANSPLQELPVADGEKLESFNDGSVLSATAPPHMNVGDELMETGNGHPEPLPDGIKINMETPSGSDHSDATGPTQKTMKASKLNTTLGNDVLDMDTIRNIKVNVQAVLGGISMSVSKLSNLKEGELVSLEKTIGEEIEILANGQLIAHGEIVVIEGDIPKFGITITSVVGS